jgi:hypothetical protein
MISQAYQESNYLINAKNPCGFGSGGVGKRTGVGSSGEAVKMSERYRNNNVEIF